MRRLLALLPCAVVLALPAVAGAHGGAIVANGSNDTYDVTVQIADVTIDGEPVADVTVYPIASSNGAIDPDAEVTVSVDGKTYPTEWADTAHHVNIPVEETGGWKDWQVGARVEGEDGSITVGDFPAEPAEEEEVPAPAEEEAPAPTATTGDGAGGATPDDAAPPPDSDQAEEEDDGGMPGWLIPVSVVLILAAGALVVQRRRAMRGENPVA